MAAQRAVLLDEKEKMQALWEKSLTDHFHSLHEAQATLGDVSQKADARHEATASRVAALESQLKAIIRPMYSSPPIHGALIVKEVLSDAALSKQYYAECAAMAERIGAMRTRLRDELEAAGSTHDWAHITNQIGMFAFTGLNKDQVNELREKYAIYMTMDGRISIAGLNTGNLDYVADAFHKVTHGK